jgi:hypothetical protein
MTTLRRAYRDLFSIDEIERSSCLQALYWALIFGFFLSFQSWISVDWAAKSEVARNLFVCPTYFPHCDRFYFFDAVPESYSQVFVFAILMGILTLSAVAAVYRRWSLAHALLIPPTLFKIVFAFFLTYHAVVEYEYFHLPEVAVFLLASRKEYFARRMLVLTYFFAATVKFTEAWIVGSYFSSLRLGLPGFPAEWTPFVTNATILFEIFTPIALLSTRARVRLTAVAAWALFHLYSIAFVGFTYPAHCLTLLFALFLTGDFEARPRFAGRAAVGWVLVAMLAVVNALPWIAPAGRLYTLQARKFGAQMFDSNHQCASDETTFFKDGRRETKSSGSSVSMRRCPPYEKMFEIQQRCTNPDVKSIAWTFDSSVNGGPFYRIVDVVDACRLAFSDFGKNGWIRLPDEGAAVVGYPRKNRMGGIPADMDHAVIAATPDPGMLVPEQDFFVRHLRPLTRLYWVLWMGMGAALFLPFRRRLLRSLF